MAINEIIFPTEKYYLHEDMIKWCEQFIGPGSWTYSHSDNWEGTKDKWRVSAWFKQTRFSFKDERDYQWFYLKWA